MTSRPEKEVAPFLPLRQAVFFTGGYNFKMISKKIAALFVCLSATMWGFGGVVLTPRLYNLDVGFVVFMLHFIPFCLMNLLLFREYKEFKTFTGSDLFYLLLIALFGVGLGTLAIVKALFLVNFEHLTVVALLQKFQPVIAIILAACGSVKRKTDPTICSLGRTGHYRRVFSHLPVQPSKKPIQRQHLHSRTLVPSVGLFLWICHGL